MSGGPPKEAAPSPGAASDHLTDTSNARAGRINHTRFWRTIQEAGEDTFALFSNVAGATLSRGEEKWPRTPTWQEVAAMPLDFFIGGTDQERAVHRFLIALDLWFDEQEAQS